MDTMDLGSLLRSNPYPGRGIILGRSEDGGHAVLLYFIMGRSENSRNRIFVKTDDGIKTQAYDPKKMTDPSLVIYHPVRRLMLPDGIRHIVTNGDQTDTIRDYLNDGNNFMDALLTREFEPDAPNYTPRISGLLFPDGLYMLSILKTQNSDPGCCLRHFFTYSFPLPGVGHFIHTYSSDGDPLPSFEGEPTPISIAVENGLENFARIVWDSMNDDNKVSLYASEIEIASGTSREIIINKREGIV